MLLVIKMKVDELPYHPAVPREPLEEHATYSAVPKSGNPQVSLEKEPSTRSHPHPFVLELSSLLTLPLFTPHLQHPHSTPLSSRPGPSPSPLHSICQIVSFSALTNWEQFAGPHPHPEYPQNCAWPFPSWHFWRSTLYYGYMWPCFSSKLLGEGGRTSICWRRSVLSSGVCIGKYQIYK